MQWRASHATCEAQLTDAATRSANTRITARAERGEAIAELAASWETVARPQVTAGGVTVASVNAHVEALIALTARRARCGVQAVDAYGCARGIR